MKANHNQSFASSLVAKYAIVYLCVMGIIFGVANLFALVLIFSVGDSLEAAINIILGVNICLVGPMAVVAFLIFLGVYIQVRIGEERDKRVRAIQISNIDYMEGLEFESYLQKLFTSQGYYVELTKASGDLGVDLVAYKNGEKIAIQAKRYSRSVSRRAISDAVAGKIHYGCNKAMVVTNNYFSPGAVELAKSTGCVLVDRNTLVNWIIEFQKTNSKVNLTQ